MKLSEKEIVEAALVLIDTKGVAAMTMRALAARLHCDPMAIYYHLPSKDAVLDAIAARLEAEGSPPTVWRGLDEALSKYAQRQLNVAFSHPRAIPIFALRPSLNSATVAGHSWLRARLSEAGVEDPDFAEKLFTSAVNGVLLYFHATCDRTEARRMARALMTDMVAALCGHWGRSR